MKRTMLLLSLACAPTPAIDAGVGVDAGVIVDVAIAADAGGGCTFNEDCRRDERCACDERTGCACVFGVRGTGRSGVDSCVDGADCETSLCVEGADQFYCSGPCVDDADCGAALPVCADIVLVGRICIRE